MQSAAQNITAIRLLDNSFEDLRNKIEKYHDELMQPEVIARRLMADYCGVRLPHEGIVKRIATRVEQALADRCSETSTPVSTTELALPSQDKQLQMQITPLRFTQGGCIWVMLKDIGRIAGYSDDGSKLIESVIQAKLLRANEEILYFKRDSLDMDVIRKIPKHSPGFFAVTIQGVWKIATYYKRLGLTDAMKDAISKVFPEIGKTGNFIGNVESLSTTLQPDLSAIKTILKDQQTMIDNLQQNLGDEIEQQRKQYRVLTALIPKITDVVQNLVKDTEKKLDTGILAMLTSYQDKLHDITQASQQKLYTATQIAQMLNVAPSTIGRIAKQLGYKGNPNYCFITLATSKGRTFPKEKALYKEVAILGLTEELNRQRTKKIKEKNKCQV